jgi:hypothetical protein
MTLQHGFTVERTTDADLNSVQQRVKGALDKLAAGATSSQLTDHGRYTDVGTAHLQGAGRGADVVAASAIGPKSAYVHITGATAVNYISTGSWFDGARVELLVINGVTFNHNSGAPPTGSYPLQMIGGANLAKAINGVIAFRRDDALKRWVQVA